ncbi:hypothetical protein [Paraburkholderia monticola]|uniref:hypothetical protein n=1 Tax=Paraburkholderia monticola TaxID=1399968 RepID=UPI001379E485|nr:hypothetical protein [Paraburkholderia monticola]
MAYRTDQIAICAGITRTHVSDGGLHHIHCTKDLTMTRPNPAVPAGLGVDSSLELLRPQQIKFGAANVAEPAEDVDRTVGEHLAQLKERPFRGVVRIRNLPANLIGFSRNLCRGLDTYTAYLREQTDESSKVRLIVLKCVDIAMRRLLNELVIKVLPADAIVRKPLCLGLRSLRDNGCQASDRCAEQCRHC